ncbi:unnamed protein product [Psylliodes chrysocephalus]|uniref:Uncharacterized protein n=1 Tax=Psylliodes chrysocephalus TaxID=3402493 RepID=A0A9P0CZG2_9CUCU|nr:unnamed protein product [Psylliodes chrysocephala]
MMYSLYISGGMCVYAGISILESKCDVNDDNNNFCGTLTQITLPIDGDIPSITIKLIFLFQLAVCIWACVGAGNLFFVSFESAEFLICHMNRLKKKVIDIFKHEDENTRKQMLGFCVRYHNSIIE